MGNPPIQWLWNKPWCVTHPELFKTAYNILEGPWSAVCQAIQDCHRAVHDMGAGRIATDVRIGTRTDRDVPNSGLNERKVQRVEEVLNQWKSERPPAYK
jgi:hypothetical protein